MADAITEGHEMTTRSLLLVLIPVAALMGACTANPERAKPPGTPPYLAKEYTDFRERLRQCTLRYGYDPNQPSYFGPYDLGQGELAWRDCAYSALRATIVPATTHPELYLALIEKDKELTSGIQEKRITRDQREAQIAEQRQRILVHEENASDELDSGLTNEERQKRRDFLMESTRSLINNLPMGR